MNRRSLLRLAWLALVALVLGACGVDEDSAPRDIPDADRPSLASSNAQATGASSGTDRIYLLAPETSSDAHQLRPSARDVGPSATARLQSLFGPLSVSELSARLHTAIPEGLQLHSATLLSTGTLSVDVSDELLSLAAGALIDAVAQIVFTAAEVDSVRRVDLLVDGKPRQWPAGDGELHSAPLTVYDFPGFLESSQPDFPAIPSPAA